MCTKLEWATNEREWEGYMAKKREGIFRKEAGFTSAESTAITNQTISESDYKWIRVWHKWFPSDSVVQNIVTYAYKLGGYDFLAVLECENWTYQLDSLGDNNHAHWLCQANDRFHKDIPSDYTTNWVVAVEYCYQKWKAWVPFYWPWRIIKGKKCYEYVKDRFTYTE